MMINAESGDKSSLDVGGWGEPMLAQYFLISEYAFESIAIKFPSLIIYSWEISIANIRAELCGWAID